MTTPRWLTRARKIRDDILECDAAIRQIVGTGPTGRPSRVTLSSD